MQRSEISDWERVSGFMKTARETVPRDVSIEDFRNALPRGEEPPAVAPGLESIDDVILPDGLRVRVYRPRGHGGPLPVLVYMHGGGHLRGTLASAHIVCTRLAIRTPSIVVSVDYRLAPEHPFPAALNDAQTALEWAAEHATMLGAAPGAVAIGGDSAGATLATVVARRLPQLVKLQKCCCADCTAWSRGSS